MNSVAVLLGEQGDLLFIGGHDRFELVAGAAGDVREQRQNADSFRQETDEFFKRAGRRVG